MILFAGPLFGGGARNSKRVRAGPRLLSGCDEQTRGKREKRDAIERFFGSFSSAAAAAICIAAGVGAEQREPGQSASLKRYLNAAAELRSAGENSRLRERKSDERRRR